MGLGIGFSNSHVNQPEQQVIRVQCDCGKKVEASLPNPNPSCCRIIRTEQVGDYLVAMIHYPDCTNYEGRKICVFECSIADLMNQKSIDPHFSESRFAPIARFEPTERGWFFALTFVEARAKAC